VEARGVTDPADELAPRPAEREPAPERASVRPIAKLHGLPRLFGALRNSWGGFTGAWREEAAFRQEVVAAVVLVPLGLWLGKTGVERVLLVAPIFLVLIVELLNSSIEATVDRIGAERHQLSGLAKDLGSAAVLVALLLVFVVWALVLLG
jgi:diacylglycerol kinase (ATP)